MPNRIIKDTIRTSESVAEMTDFEFRLWIGLIVSADDAGRGDARPAIIKGSVFPLRDRVTVKDISAALHGLAAKGCVSLYEVDGKPYFWFPTWKDHQRIRDCKPKYPEPPAIDKLPQSAASCGELPQSAARIQYESEYESESESNTKEKGKRAGAFTPPTVDDVAEYCREQGYSVPAERFVSYYTSNGWKVGKNPMKDWQAAVRTWASKDKNEGRSEHGLSEPAAAGNRGGDRNAAWGIKSVIDDC